MDNLQHSRLFSTYSDEEAETDENGHYEYKDEEQEETYTSTTRIEKRSRTKRRTGAGNKKLDLGAAAVYAGDAKSDTKSTHSQVSY